MQIARRMELEKELAGIGMNNVSGAVKQLGTGLEGLKKDAIFDARASSMLRGVSYLARGIAITAPISIAAERYERTQKQTPPPAPEMLFPNYRRHLSTGLYSGDKYALGLACGVTDGMIDLVDIPVNMLKNTVKYVGSGFLTLISKAVPTPAGTVGREASKYFSGVNATANEMGSELWEFFVEYNTNPLFKKMFTDQVEAELKDYFRRLGGANGEQGYAHGRALVDVVALLASVGTLKKLMGSWKRLKTFRLKDYLPAVGVKQGKSLTGINKEIKMIERNTASAVKSTIPKALPPVTQQAPKTAMNYSPITKFDKADEMVIRTGYKHVFNVNRRNGISKKGTFEFSGGHTEDAIRNYTTSKGGGRHVIKNKITNYETGVYQGKVVIEMNNGMSISKATSSFYPKNWPQERILKEVKFAANNLKGMHPAYGNAYIGETQGGIQIVFFCNDEMVNGKKLKKIISFFPLTEKLAKFE